MYDRIPLPLNGSEIAEAVEPFAMRPNGAGATPAAPAAPVAAGAAIALAVRNLVLRYRPPGPGAVTRAWRWVSWLGGMPTFAPGAARLGPDGPLSLVRLPLYCPLGMPQSEEGGPGTRPYQVIPFQWSLHVRDRAGDLSHYSFLADGDGDPREGFADSLLDAIEPDGTIVSYSTYEQTRVNELADDLPEYTRRLLDLNVRFFDLYKVLRMHYYHPDFHGSHSLKAVAPALVPEVGYQDLKIQDGGNASLAFEQMVASETAEHEKARIREALLAYCQRDTETMVRIFDALH